MDFKSNLRVKYRDRVDSPFPSVPISYPAHNPPLSSHATPPHRFTPFRDELQRSTPGTLSGSSSSWPRRGPSKTCSRNSVRTAPYLNLNIDDTGHALPAVIAISHRANDSLRLSCTLLVALISPLKASETPPIWQMCFSMHTLIDIV